MKLPVEKTRPFANPMRFERASPASRAWIVRFGARERVRGAVECDGSVSRSRVARLRRGAVWRGVARGMADLDEVRVVLLDPRVLALQRIDGLDVFDRLARAPAGLGVSLVHDRVGLARDLREEVESPTDEMESLHLFVVQVVRGAGLRLLSGLRLARARAATIVGSRLEVRDKVESSSNGGGFEAEGAGGVAGLLFGGS
mmetsp:Transcript_45422/g.125307  ORF Transcript_45422/g.125307 Transcript_45422/m.125307 type:complete len:200 (-) Transcript_45422:415-1014(-)